MELKLIIESFINKGYEGSHWDFKQNWHNDNADLLKDIICMANNTTTDMQDGYIIFGIDNTLNIIGVSTDSNLKNQENVIEFLIKSKKRLRKKYYGIFTLRRGAHNIPK